MEWEVEYTDEFEAWWTSGGSRAVPPQELPETPVTDVTRYRVTEGDERLGNKNEYEERAAIMEFNGGLSREEAERRARAVPRGENHDSRF